VPTALLGTRGRQRIVGPHLRAAIREIPNPVSEPRVSCLRHELLCCSRDPRPRFRQKLLNRALSWCRRRRVDAVILWPTAGSKSLYRHCGLVEPMNIIELPYSAHRCTEFDHVFVALHTAARSTTPALRQNSEFRWQRLARSASLIAIYPTNNRFLCNHVVICLLEKC
jgi:hypothetical protein